MLPVHACVLPSIHAVKAWWVTPACTFALLASRGALRLAALALLVRGALVGCIPRLRLPRIHLVQCSRSNIPSLPISQHHSLFIVQVLSDPAISVKAQTFVAQLLQSPLVMSALLGLLSDTLNSPQTMAQANVGASMLFNRTLVVLYAWLLISYVGHTKGGNYSTNMFQSRMCACTQKTGTAGRESLRRDHPGGLTSPVLHACGSASPFAHAINTETIIGRIFSHTVVDVTCKLVCHSD